MMSTLLTEVFPIRADALPDLHAYHIETSSEVELNTLGGGLQWQIKKQTDNGGTWVWSRTHQRLFSNRAMGEEVLNTVVEACWSTGKDRYRALDSIVPDPEQEIDARALADYVAWGLWHQGKYEVAARLKPDSVTISPVHVRRTCTRTPCVVEGIPGLQLSIRSEMTHQDSLSDIVEQHADLELEGLAVKDNTKDRNPLKGAIRSVIGPIEDHRQRLLGFPDLSKSITEALQSADKGTPVVGVVPFGGTKPYEYVIDALDVIVQPRHYDQLQIPPRVQNKLTLSPDERSKLLRKAITPLKERGWIGNAFNSQSSSSHFGTAETVGYTPSVRFKDGTVVDAEHIRVGEIADRGAVAPVQAEDTPLRLAILKVADPPASSRLGGKVQKKLGNLGVDSFEGKVFHAASSTKSVRGEAVSIVDDNFDAALVLIPNGADEVYRTWKQEAVGQDLPNQVILHDTLDNQFATENIALGLFAKMGGVPYVLAEPLSYADRVVGLDIGRVSKERAGGTMSVAASTHLYGADGHLIGYRLEDANVEGETVPAHVLRKMFPRDAYGGKRVIVHRDGPFRGDEISTLREMGQEMDATFHLVEVRKQGAPRLYAAAGDGVSQPPKGSYFRINDRVAYVVSSPPPFSGSTARPLHIRVRSDDLTIEDAIHSVLSFTLMHHGSVRPPRLPVSLHYSDNVAGRLQNGIRPPNQKGTLPYWL